MSTVMDTELVVVGGGPAGLAAAIRAAECGTSVVLIEENVSLGGKLRGQLHEELSGEWWIGWDLSSDLASKAQKLGITILTETVVWGVEDGWRVRVSSSRGGTDAVSEITARAVLIATGAVECSMPAPGWTLPGVITIGGAQVLTNIHRVRPGKRTVVVGVDPLSITIGRSMKLGDVEVESIVLPPASVHLSSPVETLKRLAGLSKLAPYFYMRFGGKLLALPGLAAVAARLLPRSLSLWGIPLKLSTRLVRVVGDDCVTGVELERVKPNGQSVPGSRRIVAVDSVCLSNGLVPLNDLAGALGLEFVNSSSVGGRVPLHSTAGATQKPGLYLAGNALGVEGAKVALKQGEIAGSEIASYLGHQPYQERERELSELRRMRRESEFTFNEHIQAGHDEVEALFQKRVTSGTR